MCQNERQVLSSNAKYETSITRNNCTAKVSCCTVLALESNLYPAQSLTKYLQTLRVQDTIIPDVIKCISLILSHYTQDLKSGLNFLLKFLQCSSKYFYKRKAEYFE